MNKFFFKLSLLVVVLAMSSTVTFSQFTWTKYPSNPLSIHGSSGSWDRSVVTPFVLFNSDLNRYEMWFTAWTGDFPNGGIGFAYSNDGLTWTKSPDPVLRTSFTGWDSLFVGVPCVIKEGGSYKMWYTGSKATTRIPSHIGYATSPDGINWTKHAGNPVFSTGSGWESARVEYPSVIKVTGGYWMFYTGELAHGIARTGRAFSTDGIIWQRDLVNNPVLQSGGSGAWDQNNYLGRVVEFNNTLYLYYCGETNPGVSGSAIGVTTSVDTGKTWTKYSGNPIISQGQVGSWDYGWIEMGSVLFKDNTFKMWYDGGGSATSFLGRIGYATSPIVLQNWQIQTSNFPADVMVMDFSTPNEQVCWAIGYSGTPYGGYSHTTNGGNTWVCDTIGNNWNGYLYQVCALDENTAYILSQSGSSKGIYKTTDGGSTWNRQNAYNTALYGPGYIHFFDSQNGVVVGDPNLETYTTTNGGLTWNPVTMPSALADEYAWNSGNGITAVGNTVWFSTGARVFKSTNKGYNWSVILTEPQYNVWWPCIKFQDSQTGIYSLKILGGINHIYRKTTDGGATWNTLSNSILDNLAPAGMQHIPGTTSTYVVSGDQPQGMRGVTITRDAGESWILIDNGGCNFIEFPSISVGWGSQYDENTIQKYIGPPLPVELTSFTATSNGNIVMLNWSTATELNNYGFEIQRKALGGDFGTVAFVKGQGTTAQQNQYSFVDKNLDEGKYFYRLKQMDYGGQFNYSQIVEVDVRMLNKFSLEQNYPNPFNPTTTLGYVLQEKSNAKLTLLNSLGEEIAVLVNEEQDKGYHKVEFNGSRLASGVYFYKLTAGSFISTRKMMLLK